MRKGEPDFIYFGENLENEVILSNIKKTSQKSLKIFTVWFVKELTVIGEISVVIQDR